MEEKQNSQTFLDFNQSVLKPSTREQISEVIKESYKKSIPLEINGLNSKNKIGRNFQAEKTLDLSQYSGVIEYKPEELYIKVKAGARAKKKSCSQEVLYRFSRGLHFFPGGATIQGGPG